MSDPSNAPGVDRLNRRRRRRLLERIGSQDGNVRGYHGACPGRAEPWHLGSSYDALFLDEYGRICCRECGAVDLGDPRVTAGAQA